jgi:hypothetical protein
MQAIDPEQWLALEEGDRLDLIYEFHQDAGIEVPDMQTHATLHCVIENQIALGDELPIAATLRRLLEEGLDRHDAIHAIASVLVNHLFDMVHGEDASRAQDIYFAEVAALTAAQWLRGT